MFESFFSVSKAPEIPTEFEWINSEELSLLKLRGHIIILDFWTYCCINCMHTLSTLDTLEKKYKGKPVIFIGVHSGKFSTEQETKNVQSAVLRYEIKHPVIVDKKMQMWSRFGVSAWPTIIIIDPNGNIIYKQAGEAQYDIIDDIISTLLQKHGEKGTLAKTTLSIQNNIKSTNNVLSFPGKVSISKVGKMAISDSNHNRILVADISGKILSMIGSGKVGLSDGDFETAEFFRPQGVAWYGEDLIVADTENHAIRQINFKQNNVATIAGTGKQSSWMSVGGKGRSTSISSPWDVACSDELVYVAMAGNHQIWTYDTKTEMIMPFAGTGQENIIDGPIKSANLAQPSGISLFANKLYFVDSETSAIRQIDLLENRVNTISGHGLFEFGHEDGHVDTALFQHPLGICASNDYIFVADTYNSAIRIIDTKNNQVFTLVGKTEKNTVCLPENTQCEILPLYEPSDVELYENKLYITDTNNHLIRVFDLKMNTLDNLILK